MSFSSTEKNLMPVLIGADMNCYSVARAFHEEYGVKSKAFGRWPMGETKYTRIVDFTSVPDIDEDKVLLATLDGLAAEYPNHTKVLMGCTDDYAAIIIRNRDYLAKNYIVPYIGTELMDKLVSKQSFYEYCDKYAIPYPATVIVRKEDDGGVFDSLPFNYPCVIKPSSSIEYWKYPFDGMQKVYFAKDADHGKKIAEEIFASGYSDSLIVQDNIPGRDSKMMVLTAYCDRHKKVKMMCLGHVLLEEHTPKARGNHAAILTEYNGPLMESLKSFLENIGYTGYANFDIKYDERDGQYKVFEINLRQGRSNYYVTGAGLNIARYVVQDRVMEKDLGEPVMFKGESFWHSIPLKIVWEYTGDADLVRRAKAISDAGRDTTTLGYSYDLRFNPLRFAYIWEHNRRYYKKYATYCPKP